MKTLKDLKERTPHDPMLTGNNLSYIAVGYYPREKLEKFLERSKNSLVTVLENDALEIDGVRFLGCTLWAPTNQRMRTSMKCSIEWLCEMLSKEYGGKTILQYIQIMFMLEITLQMNLMQMNL